jgi:hypothetical protein
MMRVLQGSGFRVQRFRVQGSRFRVQGLGLRLRLRPHTQGSRFGVLGSRFKVLSFGFKVSGINPAFARLCASLVEKETLKKRITNIEQGITNIEVKYSIFFKRTERSDSSLRHSAVRYSIFCGSLFN